MPRKRLISLQLLAIKVGWRMVPLPFSGVRVARCPNTWECEEFELPQHTAPPPGGTAPSASVRPPQILRPPRGHRPPTPARGNKARRHVDYTRHFYCHIFLHIVSIIYYISNILLSYFEYTIIIFLIYSCYLVIFQYKYTVINFYFMLKERYLSDMWV